MEGKWAVGCFWVSYTIYSWSLFISYPILFIPTSTMPAPAIQPSDLSRTELTGINISTHAYINMHMHQSTEVSEYCRKGLSLYVCVYGLIESSDDPIRVEYHGKRFWCVDANYWHYPPWWLCLTVQYIHVITTPHLSHPLTCLRDYPSKNIQITYTSSSFWQSYYQERTMVSYFPWPFISDAHTFSHTSLSTSAETPSFLPHSPPPHYLQPSSCD